VTATTGVTLPLDGVSSSGSGTDGINLDGLGAGTFTATGGTISGAAGIAFDLNGGDGTVSYPGTLGNGTGATAEITGRSGGAVTLSGPIADTNDAGGGIALSGSSSGSTTFSNASKVINTGAGATAAVSMSGTHTLSFQGGGLDIDTTTAPGMDITGGTIDVQGSGNSITTGSGRALNVSGAGIGAPDMTFASISSNGATNGIALSSTGSSGGLAVSGGTIQSSTGPGILLTNVGGGVDLSGNTVTAGGDDGIRGTNVAGFAMSGTSVTSNGNAVGENGLDFTGLTGTVALTIPTVTGSADRNVAVVNDSGTLNMTVINGTIANTSSTTGDDGVLLLGTGSGSMTATIQGTTFTDNKGDQVNMSTDADATLTQNLTITGTTMSTTAANQGPAGYVVGGGITVNPGGSANSDVTITNNNIQRATDEAIVIDTPGTGAAQPVNIDATITGNTIGTAGTAGSGSSTGTGIFMSSNGAGDIDAIVSNNSVREYANGSGIHLIQNDGNGKLDATVQNNVITNPGAFGLNGIRAEAGAAGGDAGTMCLDVGHASTLALKNNVFQGGKESAAGEEDMRVRQRFDTTVQLAGYSGASDNTTDVANYLIARNNAGGTPTASATVNNGAGAEYVSVVSCVQP